MVSSMDVESSKQSCDNHVILSQSAVSQKSIDLDLSIKSPTSPTAAHCTILEQAAGASLVSSPPPVSSTTVITSTIVAVSPVGSNASTTKNNANDTDLAKKAMKLDLVDATTTGNLRTNWNPVASISTASSSTSVNASAASTATHSSTSTSAVTTTTAIIMKHHHHKLKERTFSDEVGSPKSPASTTEVVDDRKALRDALYQGIFHRHRRTIFAVGSFLRMLKSRNSSYNTIRSSSEGEDDTR
ncbi:uncharacterized protein LOC131272481 isoform X2 [Anopheles coustani]|uniref:uncharacterized protein LOC131272481 isoform X2 n=1 Tax=Anopheles coustani TaxID=139045 RepID=UPI002658466C|nr:uncharacterized protein LOC131272481 isoform X2 [Anopheles coustani]